MQKTVFFVIRLSYAYTHTMQVRWRQPFRRAVQAGRHIRAGAGKRLKRSSLPLAARLRRVGRVSRQQSEESGRNLGRVRSDGAWRPGFDWLLPYTSLDVLLSSLVVQRPCVKDSQEDGFRGTLCLFLRCNQYQRLVLTTETIDGSRVGQLAQAIAQRRLATRDTTERLGSVICVIIRSASGVLSL